MHVLFSVVTSQMHSTRFDTGICIYLAYGYAIYLKSANKEITIADSRSSDSIVEVAEKYRPQGCTPNVAYYARQDLKRLGWSEAGIRHFRGSVESIGGINNFTLRDFDLAKKFMNKDFQILDTYVILQHHDFFSKTGKKAIRRTHKFFKRNSFCLTEKSTHDLQHEFGTKGTISGLLKDRDCSWMLNLLFAHPGGCLPRSISEGV